MAPGTGWSYDDLVPAYWKAVEKHQHESVKLLIKKNRRLLHELSEKGFNGLETCLYSNRSGHGKKLISLLFLKLGIDPFARWLSD